MHTQSQLNLTNAIWHQTFLGQMGVGGQTVGLSVWCQSVTTCSHLLAKRGIHEMHCSAGYGILSYNEATPCDKCVLCVLLRVQMLHMFPGEVRKLHKMCSAVSGRNVWHVRVHSGYCMHAIHCKEHVDTLQFTVSWRIVTRQAKEV